MPAFHRDYNGMRVDTADVLPSPFNLTPIMNQGRFTTILRALSFQVPVASPGAVDPWAEVRSIITEFNTQRRICWFTASVLSQFFRVTYWRNSPLMRRHGSTSQPLKHQASGWTCSSFPHIDAHGIRESLHEGKQVKGG